MKEYSVKGIIKPYLGKTIQRRDRKASTMLLSNFEKLPFFKMVTRNHPNNWKLIHSNIISHLVFQEFEPDQIIFNYGEEITGMYIIIDGKVNIYHIKKEYEKKLNRANEIIDNKKKEKILDINEKYIFSQQLMKGNDLGEECFKYNKKKVYYLATSASNSILGYLSKENYEKIFGKPNSIELNILTGFLIELKYFNESCFTKKMQCYTYKHFYEKDSYIFTQNSEFQTFYIIYSGSVNISLKLKRTVKCLLDEEFLLGNNSKTERFTTSRIHELKGNYKENKNLNLISYGEGEIIGGIEFMKNLKKYLYTAKCLTDAELIGFNIKEFKYVNKIKQSQNFKDKINEQLNFFIKRIKSINSNIKNSTIFSKENKFMKTFLENHIDKREQEKKYNYLYNIFDSKIKLYRPKYFNKTNMRPLSAAFKHRNKSKDINSDTNKSKQKRNTLFIKYNRIKNKSDRPKSPNYKSYYFRNNNNNFNLKKNFTENDNRPKSLKKVRLLNIEEIKKNLSNYESNSITTNIGTKSSYNFTDRYNSDGFNSLSTHLYFTSPKQKENKDKKNRINIFRKLNLNKNKNRKNIKTNTINLFKENKKNKNINKNKFSGVQKLFIIRDEYNEKMPVSNILRNMFFSPQNKKVKNKI